VTIYIIDPVCVQDIGHNLIAIKRYGNLAKKIKNEKIVIAVSKVLHKDLASSSDSDILFTRFFSHYYPDFISVDGIKGFMDKEGILNEDISYLAINELEKFSDFHSLTSDDTVFYPSVDYFSLLALCKYLETTSIERIPKIILRFIGVMEYDHYKIGQSIEMLLTRIGKIGRVKPLSIKFSAESDIMANYIENITGNRVEVTPTLVESDALKQPCNEVFTIVFPGAARRDKGFDRISSILDALEAINPRTRYRVFVQLLPPSELKHYGGYALELIKNGKVTLLPCALDENEILNLFEVADLVVAPYDEKIYRHRSSAIMAEAAIYGRPIVASENCGFSNQIKQNELGLLALTNADFAEKIEIFRAMQPSQRSSFALNARNNFLLFSKNAYTKLFS
jgi:glycosyltransferase involved in cell wall biosynthesis